VVAIDAARGLGATRVIRRRFSGRFWVYLAAGLVSGVLGSDGHAPARFNLSSGIAAFDGTFVNLPVQPVCLTVALFCVALAVLEASRVLGRHMRRIALILFVIAVVLAFLTWANAGRFLSVPQVADATVTGGIPLLLGGLAGLLCERAGVINVAIEGQFILGSFAASVFASLAGVWLGLGAGAVAGVLIAGLLAILALEFFADQIIIGIVLILLAQGSTSFLFTQVVIPHQSLLDNPPLLTDIEIPWLASIPVIGGALFDQNVIWYFAVALLVAIQVGLYKTRWGLRVQAVGERPEAADSAGVSVKLVRYRNVILGGVVAGVGGAFLTVGSVGAFNIGITSGYGFIALAALIVGRWRPLGVFGAAMMFGFVDATQSSLSLTGGPIPSAFLSMFPYIVTIVAVAGLVGHARPPAAAGRPFIRS
jgi:ABC-type uncharacterized transport system permease subunit